MSLFPSRHVLAPPVVLPVSDATVRAVAAYCDRLTDQAAYLRSLAEQYEALSGQPRAMAEMT